MMQKDILIMQKNVGEAPKLVRVPHTNDSFNKIVEGWIEVVRIADDLLLVINEEGLLKDLPINFLTCIFEPQGPKPVHEIRGNAFFVGIDGEDFASVTDEQMERVLRMFRYDNEICIAKEYRD